MKLTTVSSSAAKNTQTQAECRPAATADGNGKEECEAKRCRGVKSPAPVQQPPKTLNMNHVTGQEVKKEITTQNANQVEEMDTQEG